jgi:hypothetical protein
MRWVIEEGSRETMKSVAKRNRLENDQLFFLRTDATLDSPQLPFSRVQTLTFINSSSSQDPRTLVP